MAILKEIMVFDVMAHLRRDPAKARLVQSVIDNVKNLEHAVVNGKADRSQIAAEMARLVPLCGFNFGMLLPYVFPRYPSTEPLCLLARPFMFAMTSMSSNNVLTLRAGRQIGKCADRDTKVSTHDHGELTLGQIFDLGAPISSDSPA